MSPGIGLMNRRLETKESAISLAISGITKKFNVQAMKYKVWKQSMMTIQEIGMLHWVGKTRRQL